MTKNKKIFVQQIITVSCPVEDCCAEDCRHLKVIAGGSNYCKLFEVYMPLNVRCVECVDSDCYTTKIMKDIANLYSLVKEKADK